jgi:hypothetical protein
VYKSDKEFINAYIEAALWSSTCSDGVEDDTGPLEDLAFDDGAFSEYSISLNSMKQIVEDCLAFIEKNEPIFSEHWTYEQAGHDFWLDRNGHGTGFWDRGYDDEGAELCENAAKYKEVYLLHNASLELIYFE